MSRRRGDPIRPALPEMKKCFGCARWRRRSNFHRNNTKKSGIQSRCKLCKVKSAVAWAKANPEKHRAAFARYRRKFLYGLAQEAYQSLLDKQKGKCAICKETPKGVQGIHVDHDHSKNIVRGLLCPNCNRGIGMFKEDPNRLRAAINYLTAAR